MSPKKKPAASSEAKNEGYPLILLAGGKSERMGTLKGLIEYNGRPWLEHQMSEFASSGGTHAVIVLGYQHVDYFNALPWLKEAQGKWRDHAGVQVRAAVNPLPEYGPFSSVQTGVAEVRDLKREAVFILPVDVPCPNAAVWQELAQVFKAKKLDATVPRWAEYNGHPVLLSSRFASELTKVLPQAEQARLDVQIRSLPGERVAHVPVEDPHVVMNINTPEDFDHLLA